jgi:hypothetical protein
LRDISIKIEYVGEPDITALSGSLGCFMIAECRLRNRRRRIRSARFAKSAIGRSSAHDTHTRTRVGLRHFVAAGLRG